MVVRRKKYQTGEASNFVTRKQALHKLQLNLKVSYLNINEMNRNQFCVDYTLINLICYVDQPGHVIYLFSIFLLRIFEDYVS